MADRLVLDTSLLVDYARQNYSAREFVLPLVANRVAAIHPVTVAELVDGASDRRDLEHTLRFLAPFRRLVVRSSDFERCLTLQAGFRLSHGVQWPDCLIAGTCLRLGLPLVTLNEKHFTASA